tara:strand:+ start:2720 stop:2941 length:222 start_codon:yes stop_codon:yes gene_type:complete
VDNNITENVTNPSHYMQGDIEAKVYIADQDFNFFIGSAVKYLTRYRHKHKGEGQIEDLRKAIENIQIQIDNML